MSELAESKVACDRQRPLTILFGTQSGIAERVALRIARLALKRGATAVTCLPADDVPLHRWHALGSPILIVCSNASQGQPPASFMQTWCAMLQPDVTPMTGISYAVFGVGHSKFYKFNYMGKMIHNRMKQLGGRPLLLRGLGNECDSHGLDTALQPWLMQLWSSLGWLTTEATAAATAAAAATAQEQEQTPSTTLPASPLTEQAALEATFDLPLFPLYRVEPVEQKDGRYLGQHASDYLDSPLRTSGADGESARLSARDAACLTQRIYGAEAPVLCEVVSNRRVTPAEYEQDVHALRLRVLHHTTPCSDIAAVDTAASCGMTGNESMCRDKDDCACRDANGDVLLERGSTNNNGRSVDCSNSSSCSSREGNDHGSACAGMVDDNTAQHNGTSAGWNTGLDGDGVRSSSVLRYSVGDSLGVWCPNSLTLVEKMLHLLHLDGTRVVCVRPDNSHGLIRHPRQIFCRRPMTLRFLLTHYVDLEAFVSQEFIEMMLHYIVRPAESTDANDAGEEDVIAEVEERLRELCDPRKYGEFMSFSYQEKRNVCEVLFDFPMIRPPLEMVLSFVRVMKPRYFSLASSPTADAQCPTPLDLLVARLDWQTPMRRHRRGMCSSYLVDALARTRLPCCLLEGTLSLPSAPTPLICIATGTGVAPIRALVRECAARCLADRRTGDVNARWGEMPIYLFFGCRHAEKDYYFAEEWTTMMRMMRTRGDEEEGAVLRQLRVIPAFSRAGATKCYVQHKLGEHAREIGALLRPEVHACVYVCGNAATMPKDVEATLEQIMSAVVCEGDDAWATREMRRMSREGRYQVDTWTA